jgi:hypothetical protein
VALAQPLRRSWVPHVPLLHVGCLTFPFRDGLSFAKMLRGANFFEISNIQENETASALTRLSDVTMLLRVENGRMEFSVCTGTGARILRCWGVYRVIRGKA